MQDRMLKFLNLTRSDNDNEALSAVRMANKLLNSMNLSWEKFFNCSTQDFKHEYTEQENEDFPQIEMMLEHCLKFCNGSIIDFLKSLNMQYKNRGSLTEKQRLALERIYNINRSKQ